MQENISKYIINTLKENKVISSEIIDKFKITPELCQKSLKNYLKDSKFAISAKISLKNDEIVFDISNDQICQSDSHILALSNDEITVKDIFEHQNNDDGFIPVKSSACIKRIRKQNVTKPVVNADSVEHSVFFAKKEKPKDQGIVNMFNKQAEKNKLINVKKENITTQNVPDTQNLPPSEDNSKSNAKNEIRNNKKPSISKNTTSKKKSSKVTKKSPIKTEKLFENYLDEDEPVVRGGKRKRLIMDSDDESSENDKVLVDASFTEVLETEEVQTKEKKTKALVHKPSVKLPKMDQEAKRKPVAATTSEIINGKKKSLKKVDKTFKDEDGFLVTEKVPVLVDDSDNEEKGDVNMSETVTSINPVGKENKSIESKPVTIKKNTSKKLPVSTGSGKSKQTNLMSFFQKKT